ncbi:MAG: hypothetical protein FGM41_13195 [Bacteroidetes bacterium]|nr:hypothetical protein [Bacteroidota bacterium]
MKNIYKIFSVLLLLIASNAMAQNQKVWSGSSKLFGIDSTANRGSTITWNLGLGTGSTSSKTDSVVTAVSNRNIFTRASFANTTAAMIVDTIKVIETLNACSTSTSSKLIEVFPIPLISVPTTNQTLCSGIAPANFNITLSNYAAITNIGTFNLTYEVRLGSANGTALGGASNGSISGINSTTIAINTSAWPSLSANSTYYFVITSFGSSLASPTPLPGNLSASSLSTFPQTYAITVQPTLTTPSIIAY